MSILRIETIMMKPHVFLNTLNQPIFTVLVMPGGPGGAKDSSPPNRQNAVEKWGYFPYQYKISKNQFSIEIFECKSKDFLRKSQTLISF